MYVFSHYVCIRPNTPIFINCRLSSLLILKRCIRIIFSASRKNDLADCCHKHIRLLLSRCIFYCMTKLIINVKLQMLSQTFYYPISMHLLPDVLLHIAFYKNVNSLNTIKLNIIDINAQNIHFTIIFLIIHKLHDIISILSR